MACLPISPTGQKDIRCNIPDVFLIDLVPRTGFEPARLWALPPEDSASTNFATWAFQELHSSLNGLNVLPKRGANIEIFSLSLQPMWF
jgi:hypothetical protein